MYIPCEASSWTLLHQNRKLSSRISLQNQLFCLCRLPAVYNQCLSPLTLSRFKSHSGEVYSIQHYVIKFVSDLRHVGGFLPVLGFLNQYNWPPRYNWNIVAELQISCVFAMKTSKNACIISSECTHYAYILLCKQTFQIRNVSCTVVYINNTFLSLRNSP
jgi:hypothetical protein